MLAQYHYDFKIWLGQEGWLDDWKVERWIAQFSRDPLRASWKNVWDLLDESEEVQLSDVTSVAIICDKSLMMMITMITMVTMMKVRRWYNQWQEWLLSDVTRVATYYLWQEELLQVGPILASVTPSVCATFHALIMMMILDWRSTKPRCIEKKTKGARSEQN